MIFAFLFLMTIPAANWLIGNVGTTCIPAGPCLVPVLPGLMAPSGVLMIGVALALRDIVRERFGLRVVFVLVGLGAILSALFASPALAIASAAAFAVSELADSVVYEPLRRKSMTVAVLASGFVGALVDSALFLLLAFGSLDFLAGQFVGKMWATLAFAFLVTLRRA